MSAKLLIVDDDENIIFSLKRLLRKEDYTIFSATSGQSALALLSEEQMDIALVDYKMPGMDGLVLLKKIKKKWPPIEVIIITAYGTIQSAVEAMKLGSYDYITKPINPTELRKILKNMVERNDLISENKRLHAELENRYSPHGIIGNSHPMQEVYRKIKKVSQEDCPVLLQGESGTGKELVARSIHYSSSRAKKPFVPIDCGAIAKDVIESELFGHVKGAFTGAYTSKTGLLKVADRGTAFLDEVTEMPLETQAKFLRVLQEKEIKPVGGINIESIEIRVIGSSNRDIRQEVEKERFRLDLYYRLNVVPIFLPALRERKEDIPILVKHFMDEFRTQEGKFTSISSDAIQILIDYPWPGNVRELRNIIERIFVLGSGSVIEVEHLPLELIKGHSLSLSLSMISEGKTLNELEKEAIKSALDITRGNRIEAAKILGLGKSTLYRKLKLYDIE